MYKSTCIEEARIGRTLSHTDTNNGSHSHTWNDEDQAFDYQLDQWGVEKLFPNEDEAITRELKMCIEELEKTHSKNKSQVPKAMFLAKYGSLAPYDEDTEKRFIIDHEKLQYDKTYGWTLIGIPEKEYGSLFDHDYFCIHDDLFDRIQ